MKKTILITTVIIAIVIIIAILGFVLMQKPAADNSDKTPAVTNTATPVTTPDETAGSKTQNIDISGFAFSPKTLTIKKGDTVIWTNQDSVSHTVTSDSGNELDSSLLSKEKTYTHTFNIIGSFNYHCTPHPNMKGTIIIE